MWLPLVVPYIAGEDTPPALRRGAAALLATGMQGVAVRGSVRRDQLSTALHVMQGIAKVSGDLDVLGWCWQCMAALVAVASDATVEAEEGRLLVVALLIWAGLQGGREGGWGAGVGAANLGGKDAVSLLAGRLGVARE